MSFEPSGASQLTEQELDSVGAFRSSEIQMNQSDARHSAIASAVETADTFVPNADFHAAKAALKRVLWKSDSIIASAMALSSMENQLARKSVGLENIQGIGIGLRRTAGRWQPDIAITVLVLRKLPLTDLSVDAQIPPTIDGIPVDVEEVGITRPLAGAVFGGRFRRPNIPCGVSCSNQMAGTIGAIVRARVQRTPSSPLTSEACILSNNHVLLNGNQGTIGEPITQPGFPSRDNAPDQNIALLSKWKTLTRTGNTIDAALARTSMPRMSASHVTYKLNPNPVQPSLNLAVRKDGMMTGSTMGTIKRTNMEVNVDYTDMGLGILEFVNQIQILGDDHPLHSFGARGDSGALCVVAHSLQPVGLFFASDQSTGFTYANPIGAVMAELEIEGFVPPA